MRTIFAEYNLQRNSIDIYTSAGYSCGFQSVSYFISVFRKSMGVSPAKYRKQKNND